MAEHGSTEIQKVVEELYIEGTERDLPCIAYSDGRFFIDYENGGEGIWLNWKLSEWGDIRFYYVVDNRQCSIGHDTEQLMLKWIAERALIESL